MQGPLLASRAHSFEPLMIAGWAQAPRLEGIPEKAAITPPAIF